MNYPIEKLKKHYPRILLALCLMAAVPLRAAEEGHDHAGHDHDDHRGHEHGVEASHREPEVDTHAGHDHHDHRGHEHGEEASEEIELTADMMRKTGIEIRKASPGKVSRLSTFPAEIKLNRDLSAAVTPRFRSLVLEVFGEIGDEIEKGTPLATLKNRDTQATYTVTAPRGGVIISKNLSVGETAEEGRILYEVADLSSVWAEISIFSNYQHVLRKGMQVIFIAHDGHRAEGTIHYISPMASHQTRTFTARSVLKNAPEDFTPGVFVRARIPVEEVEAEVVLPLEAVQSLDGEQVVFIKGAAGFVPRPVRLGVKDDLHVEILSGLQAGEEYVATGAFTLKSQMIIRGMDPHAGHGH
ncbi:efflux RND transporter periplasmic adaptor subunit [Kiritimatiellaeota bacterium B1221]|nr:efflux RND transporter periplasmic adaptor subunit [Kiritimatiellaeota bacterium B1221]